MTIEEVLAQLHDELATKLLKRIQDPEARPADFAQALAFLKHNGIDAEVTQNAGLIKLKDHLAEVLPFTGTKGEDPDDTG